MDQAEVDEFIAAEKLVPAEGDAPHRMEWRAGSNDQRLSWNGPVFVEGQQVGRVRVVANMRFLRSWSFILELHATEVYRLDVAPPPKKHRNPANRPSDFPPRVRCREQEHLYVDGHDTDCAKPVRGLSKAGFGETLEAFRQRTNLRIEPEYRPPDTGVQLAM